LEPQEDFDSLQQAEGILDMVSPMQIHFIE
jgi:hypothetical protein